MSPRIVPLLVFGLLLPISVCAAERPNVVVLLTDDLGWKDLGCYGGPVKTPAIDGLAAKGVRFTDFYAGAAVCSPSRATLLTGRTHLRAGVYSWIADYAQKSHLLEREVTIAEVLKRNGYSTAHFGKWHLGLPTRSRKKPTPGQHGFEYWFATGNNAQPSHRNPVNFLRNGKPVEKINGYACQIVVDDAIRWLAKQRNGSKPFFLNVWFHEPHAPLAAPAGIVAKYGKANDPAAIYSATIENTDRAIARLLKELPANTLVIYSSDNGSYRADRVGRLRGTKGSNYEGGIRVPGIFYWPEKLPKGQVLHEPAGLVDLLPTICGLLKIDKPKGVHLDGTDLSPLLTATVKQIKRHQPLFWLLPASGPTVAVRDGRYSLVAHRAYRLPKDWKKLAQIKKQVEAVLRKNGTYEREVRGSTFQAQMFEGFKDKSAEKLRGRFIRLNMFNESWIPEIKAGRYARFELFDLQNDPGQKKNLAKQKPVVLAGLKKQLLAINRSVMADAPDWNQSIESRTKVHRLKTTKRSPYDAFAYVNRIPTKPDNDEAAIDYAGRIFSRLANQEGRILLKLPVGMNRESYLGYKTFMRYEGKKSVGNCAACHTPVEFSDRKMHLVSLGSKRMKTPSLRNLKRKPKAIERAIRKHVAASRAKRAGKAKALDKELAAMTLTDKDVSRLMAFVKLLSDVADKRFRELILKANVLDTSKDIE